MSVRSMNEGFNRLFENLLLEDIESARKQYSHIPANDFDRLLRLDPTFTEEDDRLGKYGNWLLGKYKKDNPLNYDPQDVYSTLAEYDSKKNDRSWDINTNINSFRTLQDFKDAIANATEKESSQSQKNKKAKKSKDFRGVFGGENYDIFVPNSWEGDVALGMGTHWCTAAKSENGEYYYNYYLKQGGQYYVLIRHGQKIEDSPSDNMAKLQFHFESEQFLNSIDRKFDYAEFFEENEDIKEFFEEEGYEDEIDELASNHGPQLPTVDEVAVELFWDEYGGFDNDHVWANISIVDLRSICEHYEIADESSLHLEILTMLIDEVMYGNTYGIESYVNSGVEELLIEKLEEMGYRFLGEESKDYSDLFVNAIAESLIYIKSLRKIDLQDVFGDELIDGLVGIDDTPILYGSKFYFDDMAQNEIDDYEAEGYDVSAYDVAEGLVELAKEDLKYNLGIDISSSVGNVVCDFCVSDSALNGARFSMSEHDLMYRILDLLTDEENIEYLIDYINYNNGTGNYLIDESSIEYTVWYPTNDSVINGIGLSNEEYMTQVVPVYKYGKNGGISGIIRDYGIGVCESKTFNNLSEAKRFMRQWTYCFMTKDDKIIECSNLNRDILSEYFKNKEQE